MILPVGPKKAEARQGVSVHNIFVCALAIIGAAPALATTGVQVDINRPLTLFSINTNALSLRSATNPVSINSASTFGDTEAFVDFGVIRVASTITGRIKVPDANIQSPQYPYPSDRTSASGFWQDDLVISGASGAGFVDVNMYLDAAMSTQFPTAEGRSSVSLSVYLNKTDVGGCTLCGPTWSFSATQNRYRAANSATSQTGNTTIVTPGPDFVNPSFPTAISWLGWQQITIPFTFGQGFELRVGAQCTTTGDTGVFIGGGPVTQLSGASVGASCDLSNSVYWGGISAVRAANGGVVQNFGLTSISGFDYRSASPALAAVPEPTTWILMIAGIGIVGGMGRKARCKMA